jgi:hypothetical protein
MIESVGTSFEFAKNSIVALFAYRVLYASWTAFSTPRCYFQPRFLYIVFDNVP